MLHVRCLIRQLFVKLWNDGAEDKYAELVKVLVDYYNFKMGLNDIGKDLAPVANVGAQHQGRGSMKNIISFSESVIKLQKAKLEEREQYDDYDD